MASKPTPQPPCARETARRANLIAAALERRPANLARAAAIVRALAAMKRKGDP